MTVVRTAQKSALLKDVEKVSGLGLMTVMWLGLLMVSGLVSMMVIVLDLLMV
jgi:hypothetical protein